MILQLKLKVNPRLRFSVRQRVSKLFIHQGYFLPSEKMFNVEHFYAFMCGHKDLLKTEEYVHIEIPNYYTVPEFQKKSLLEYIKSKEALSRYLPESNNLLNIPREFLLCVSKFIFMKIIRAKDSNRFNYLQQLVREYNLFKNTDKHNDYKISIKQELANDLKNYQPIFGKH